MWINIKVHSINRVSHEPQIMSRIRHDYDNDTVCVTNGRLMEDVGKFSERSSCPQRILLSNRNTIACCGKVVLL